MIFNRPRTPLIQDKIQKTIDEQDRHRQSHIATFGGRRYQTVKQSVADRVIERMP